MTAAQPVAWMQLYRGMSKRFYEAEGFISRPDLGPETPLYTHPDPRIAELEGLLLEALAWLHKDAGVRKRIAAALNREGT